MSLTSAVTLFKVFGHPGNIKMVDADYPLLSVDSGAKHLCRTEKDTHISIVHCLNDSLSATLRFTLLYKAYLMRRNTIVLYQFALDFGIDIPLAGLIS